MADADLDAVAGKDDVLLGHLRLGRVADVAGGEIDVVADPASDGDDGEEDDEGEEFASGC